MKRITDPQLLGEKGINLIQSIVLEMGFTWHSSNAAVEAGIDGWVELRDAATGEVRNDWLAVQSKARSELREDAATVRFNCKKKDVEYWMKGNAPVILIVSKPEERKAWWISVKDYFRGRDFEEDLCVTFDKNSSALTASTAEEWKSLSNQYGSSTYFSPLPNRESLTSNLLAVERIAPRVYRASAKRKDIKGIREALKEINEYPPWEWAFDSKSGAVYSFHDLAVSPWNVVCDVSSVEDVDTSALSESEDLHESGCFRQLLNRCLREVTSRHRMRYLASNDCFYFLPTKIRIVRDLSYTSRTNKTSRQVVSRHYSKPDRDRVAYYRHVAFAYRFLRFGGKWFLMLEPTYVFTTDGRDPDPYAEERLSKIKAIEGDGAVSGTVQMFASLLRDRDDMLHTPYEFVGFGKLASTEVGVGIDDSAWSKIKSSGSNTPSSKAPDTFAAGLFD